MFELIKKNAPSAIKPVKITKFSNKIVAIDASMVMYQFVIATRHMTYEPLKDKEGNITSHLLGMLSRILFFELNNVKNVWVFDGVPPVLKSETLKKRKEAKDAALQIINEAKSATEGEDREDILKYVKRSVFITNQMKKDAMTLVELLGMPCISAPSESEAQCSFLAQEGIVDAIASEDMDSLAFGSPKLLRSFNNKDTIIQIKLSKVLKSFELTMDQYVDLCILCGCDYCGTIPNIGPATAYKLIKNHKNIEEILNNLKDNKKYQFDSNAFHYKETRKLFKLPDVNRKITLKWNTPNFEGLKDFLCDKKSFSKSRVDKIIDRLKTIQ